MDRATIPLDRAAPAVSPGDAQPAGATREEMLLELIGLHAAMLRLKPAMQAALILGMGLTVGGRAPGHAFISWAVLTMLVELGRAWYAHRLIPRLPHIDAKRVYRQMVAMALLSGATQGLAGVLMFPVLSIEDQAILAVIQMAVAASGAATSMSSRTIVGVFSVAVVIPTALSWGLQHPQQLVGLLVLCSLYCALLVVVAIHAERLLLRSLNIRHERDKMVRDLERSNAVVRQAMARAEESAQARARVLASASHDLRQPLHALSIYSAILAARPTPETLKEVGQNIDQIVRSLGSLLTGLLDISKLSAGNYVSHKQVFSLDELLDGLCSEHANAATAKQLVLRRHLRPVAVFSDAMAVTRIARNLLDNALKYTDAGEVCVSCGADGIDGRDGFITVSDTGKGIRLVEQERVFEEFYQIDNPGRDRSRGVGLGLAIVQRLADLIGATIALNSAPGVGTSFTLRLPAAVTHPAQRVVPARVEPAAGLAGLRVMLIDDEDDILKSMTTLLKLWQMRVCTASDGGEAHALMLADGAPDLLVADLRLRAGDHGARLAEQLQARHGRMAVLIITGDTSSEALREAEAAYPVLQKPITAEALHASILKLLGR
ncbi:hypothetical protein RD110_13050 [Rhodoferax koreense]|uniref:histidine kinase n=1 Tax=Rhodoferax koreensis TaxID=1842727 RepID=A0A1P8JW77_9BURK|nr:hybrid sensor histidine kinase/response regulator [Rhodoferax koreense]APW38007.1 hypothetical protein RD110_13050 [Rhodoferax koreense]